MSADTLQALGTALALVSSVWLLVNNVRKAPLDRRSEDIQASASAAVAIKSYSEEVVRLRAELGELRAIMHEWQDGIELLIAQVISHKEIPAWRPAMQLSKTQPRKELPHE